jgi:hypothetical protein
MATRMPVEVLEIVFQSLLERSAIDSSVSPSVVLRVCRQWNDVCARILWRDVSLRDVSLLSKFSTTAPSSNLQLVKTMSIASPPLETRTVANPHSILPRIDEDESLITEHGNIA